MSLSRRLIGKIKNSPKHPGIYLFKDKNGKILYIGKAINLQNRLKSYLETKDRKTTSFLKKTHQLSFIKVSSDLEAILLEMNLIKTFKPIYNVSWRDDKRPLYILITKDKLPRVKTVRLPKESYGKAFGPFPSPYKLKQILTTLRKIFPFCTCPERRKKPCLFVHLGLCNPSPLSIAILKVASSENKISPQKTKSLERKYRQNIKNLKGVLGGRIGKVLKNLTKEMKVLAYLEKFEDAARVRNQIERLKLFWQKPQIGQYLEDKNLNPQIASEKLKAIKKLFLLKKLQRIEGYDIANISGKEAAGSMVVFEKGRAVTNLYRRFKIKRVKGINDPQMLAEIVERRLNHYRWPLPDLILVDGGKTQVATCAKILQMKGLPIPLMGIAKKHEELVFLRKNQKFQVLNLSFDHPGLTLFREVRDEAHRFAINYHKLLRQKSLTNTK